MKTLTLLLTVLLPLTHADQPRSSSPAIRPVYTFPPQRFIENIAVRQNSHLLLTSLSVPDLYSVNPLVTTPNASVVHSFPAGTGISGISETSRNTFALITGVWDLAATRATNLTIWTVNLNRATPVVKIVTTVTNSTILNGLATVENNEDILLAADSAAGAVWKINVKTGAHSISFSSPLFLPTGTEPGTNLGINGLRVAGKYLFFSNSAQGIFGRVEIDKNGNKKSDVEVISHVDPVLPGGKYDDFAVREHGKAWIATHPNHVIAVKIRDGSQTVIANDTLLFNPTSAAFGRGSQKEEDTVYVTNGGRFETFDGGFRLVDGGVVAVDTTKF